MPGANLLQSLSRLDRAIGRAEAEGAALIRKCGSAEADRKSVIRSALAELDDLIDTLQSNPSENQSG